MMENIKLLAANKLEVGMYITDYSDGPIDTGLRQKGLIQKAATIARMQTLNIPFFYIDTAKGKDSLFAMPLVVEEISLEPLVPLAEERDKAEKVYGQAVATMNTLVEDIKLGKNLQLDSFSELVAGIQGSVARNQNALLGLSQIKNKHPYLLEHSINVSILMGIFTRHLGYDHDTMQDAVLGALLQDIGMVNVPDEVLAKSGRLTKEDWRQVKQHVASGLKVLTEYYPGNEVIHTICAQHHERLNGLGYPKGLDQAQINTFGRMAAIVDSYDAMTAPRSYKKSVPASVAMKQLLGLAKEELDKDLVYKFIRCIGVYPVGTLVELNNGRVGVVIEANLKKPDKPVVRIFYSSKSRHYIPAQVVDVSSPLLELSIVDTLSQEDLGVDLADFL